MSVLFYWSFMKCCRHLIEEVCRRLITRTAPTLHLTSIALAMWVWIFSHQELKSIPYPLNPGYLCNFLWLIECGRSDDGPCSSIDLKEDLQLLLCLLDTCFCPKNKSGLVERSYGAEISWSSQSSRLATPPNLVLSTDERKAHMSLSGQKTHRYMRSNQ